MIWRWSECKSDTTSRTGISSIWNVRQPIQGKLDWLLINDICIDSTGVVEKGDATFLKKTSNGFSKRFEYSGM